MFLKRLWLIFWQYVSKDECARGDEPTENHHLNLQLHSALWSFIASFSSWFNCPVRNFTVLVSHHSRSVVGLFRATAGGCFRRKSSKNLLYTTCSAPTGRQTQSETSWLHISSQRARYFPQELVETKNRAKRVNIGHQVNTNTSLNE